MNLNRIPFDIQSFYEIRTKKMLYVDKTDLIYDLVQSGKYVFLSRPRRFGKSLLCDTLRCYFEGRKELFEGLKIAQLEKDWIQHPVIRLDMSGIDGTAARFASRLDGMLSDYEEQYSLTPLDRQDLGTRFERIVKAAYKQSGQQVVVLIDEYDRPLQQTWQTDEHERTRQIYRSVLEMLKPLGDYLRFVFLTGITKFTQLSLFSSINNLRNISFDGRYAALCGITDEELHTCLRPYVEQMAAVRGWTVDETYDRLKANYDGYHFSRRNMVDVYNPFSVLNALESQEITNFWASSGATSLLPKFVPNLDTEITTYDEGVFVAHNDLETSDISMGKPAVFLYQSGYLTIKDSDEDAYTLTYPNSEVRNALYDFVLPAIVHRREEDISSLQIQLRRSLRSGDVPSAFSLLKAQVADVPYSNIKYAERVMHIEERYRLIISIILRALGFRVEVERMQAGGRPDIVLYTPKYTYILELKTESNGGSTAAAAQIRDRRYCEPFLTGTHPSSDAVTTQQTKQVIALGIGMDDEGKGLIDFEQIDK